MKSQLEKLIDLEYVSKIQKMNFASVGFDYMLEVHYTKIKEFSEIIRQKDFSLNFITGIHNENFKIIYFFSSVIKKHKIKVEVLFEDIIIPSINDVFSNAEFYENEVNEQFGLIFEEIKDFLIQEEDEFIISSDNFDLLSSDPFYFNVLTCGQYIKDIIPDIGYNSRFLENSAKSTNWKSFIVKSSRLDSYSGFFSNYCFVGVIEKALDVRVPERAEYLRIILAEISRIYFNLNYISELLNGLGLYALCSFFKMMREKISDLIEFVAGKKLTEYYRVGGVSHDIKSGLDTIFKSVTENLLKDLDELRDNGFIKTKLQNFCVISKKNAIKSGMTGHLLRSTGVNLDIRKQDNYGLYGLFDYNQSIDLKGDEYSRFNLKIDEIFVSYRIIEKALSKIKAGQYYEETNTFEIPYGDYNFAVESPRGRMSYYLKGNDSVIPYEIKIETPSIAGFCYLKKLKGIKLSDLPLYLFSLGFSMAEVDK